jgi:hypothetical protein
MKTLILHPNPWKNIALLLLSLIFVGAGIFIVYKEPNNWKGWLCLVFFGAATVVFILNSLPGFSYLKLTEEGFEMSSLNKKHFYKWSEVAFFGVTYVSLNKMVVFNFSENFNRAKNLRKVSTALAGWEGGLHDTFGMKAEKLAKLMNEYLIKSRFDL